MVRSTTSLSEAGLSCGGVGRMRLQKLGDDVIEDLVDFALGDVEILIEFEGDFGDVVLSPALWFACAWSADGLGELASEGHSRTF